MAEKIRLNKFISDSGMCSRRQADKFIETGHVTVNGRRAEIGAMISKTDKILVSGNPGYKNIIEYRVLTTKNMIIENQRLTWSLVRIIKKVNYLPFDILLLKQVI